MSGESVTETDIDEQTKAELQPPCGSRIVLSATGDVLSRCDRPARWVMRIKCPTDTGSGQQTLKCNECGAELISGKRVYCRDCVRLQTFAVLSVEPLR